MVYCYLVAYTTLIEGMIIYVLNIIYSNVNELLFCLLIMTYSVIWMNPCELYLLMNDKILLFQNTTFYLNFKILGAPYFFAFSSIVFFVLKFIPLFIKL